MAYTRRSWLQTMVGGLAGVALSSCRSSSPEEEFDVCVVGSGPAGSILAAELISQGVRTILLEGGLVPASRSVEPDGEPYLFASTRSIAYPVDGTRFMGDGGTSNLWNGKCPRFQPFDFSAENSYCPTGHRWPLTYEQIEPYYTRAEKALSIGGSAATQYSPPRSAPFTLPEVETFAPTCLNPFMAQYGWMAEFAPESRAPRVAETHLPLVASSPLGRVVRDAKVVSIETNADGSVAGLTAKAPDGTARVVRARRYVLAMGGIETPRLLMLAKSPQHPQGIGNGSDLVGRYFTEHLWMHIAVMPVPASRGCALKPIEQAVGWQFYDEFKRQGLGGVIVEFSLNAAQSKLTISAVLEMKPSADNRVVLSTRDRDPFGLPLAEVTLTISDEDRRTWERLKTIPPKIAASMRVAPPTFGDDTFEWCHHHMGTCRMGTDPKTSVVDPNLRVHGVSNLYLSGSSTFVTTGVGSPTLLLSALALRLADHLVAETRKPGGAVSAPVS